MKSRRSVLAMPALALAGWLFIQLVSAAPLPNAWQIIDNSTAGGSTLLYSTNLSAAQHQSATNSGFHFTVNARFVSNFGGTNTMTMSYGLGDRRFLIRWDLDTSGNLTVQVEGTPKMFLVDDGTGSALYHTHEIIYTPTNGTARYLFDGQDIVGLWPPRAIPSPAGRIAWGADASGGQAQMNFHSVSFEITGVGSVAVYDAGTAGSPTVAPDPTIQGWTVTPSVPAPGTIARPVAADVIGALPNAWQLTDNSIASGSTFSYTNQLSTAQRMAATNEGFRFAVHARLANDFAGSKTMYMSYGLGTRRFLIWWDLDSNTNLTAELDDGPTFTLTTNGTGAALYHTHEIIYSPTNGRASYLFDGAVKTNNWPSSSNASTNGMISWGAGSSGGKGQMNFHSVQFLITNQVVTNYDAGMVGDPPAAPDPVTQGWFRSPSNPAPVVIGPLSPDMALLPAATTLIADQFIPGGARLNGQANPRGSAAMAWFEWGTSLAYENITAPQPVGAGITLSGFSNSISGVIAGPDYYFRTVVSNAFAVVAGANQSFNLRAFLPSATTLAADQFTLTTARLNGEVNPNGSPAMAWFEWGTDTNYGSVTLPQAVGSGLTNKPVSDGIGGLAIGTDYFFRAVVSNSYGIAVGSNQTFNLAALRPLVTTQPADQLTNTSVRLNGQVNPQGWPTLAWFEWGTTTNYGVATPIQNLGSPNGAVPVSATITNLLAGPNYHYQLVASNAFGLAAGINQLFNLSFLLTPVADLPGVRDSSVAWGDYDNDGRLDFLLTGYDPLSVEFSQVWRNTGGGFSNVTASVAPTLPGVSFSSVAWGDYDNDSRLDFLLTGLDVSSALSQLRRNTGSGFSNATVSVQFEPEVYNGSVAWGDFDNDGRLDFLLTGSTVSQLWRNTGSGFSNVTASVAPGLPGVSASSVAWGDYDNDGRLDFLLTGVSLTGRVSQLWRNTGSGLSNVTASVAPGLPGVRDGSVAWGDYDNDGRLDFLLTGNVVSGNVSQLWRNTGSGFSNVTAGIAPGLPGVQFSSVAWGDYDNDGRLDFLLTGFSSTRVSQLWRNTGSGFSNVTASVAPSLPGVRDSSVAWGDYDNDGRLDFLLTGGASTGVVSQLWRNNLPGSNTPPAAPTGLAATVSGNTVMLNWSASTDNLTPSTGLNYNVRIGLTPGGSNILSPQALPNGRRLVPQMGNAGGNLNAAIQSLPAGNYYWSVQAVDTSFAGSPFATEQQFIVGLWLINPTRLSDGRFRLQFLARPAAYSILGTNNVAVPGTNWPRLGTPLQVSPNLFEFIDTNAPVQPQRYYLLRSP